MLNSTEYRISTAHKTNMLKMTNFFVLKLSDVFILLINVKMPTIVGILTFMSRINFMLSKVKHEHGFIGLGPGILTILVLKL